MPAHEIVQRARSALEHAFVDVAQPDHRRHAAGSFPAVHHQKHRRIEQFGQLRRAVSAAGIGAVEYADLNHYYQNNNVLFGPAKAANAALARKFVEFAASPEIQAEGIVKKFNWYPGIDAQHVQAKLDKASWDKLPKADQDLIRKLSREAQIEQRALWDAYTGEAETKLKAAGIPTAVYYPTCLHEQPVFKHLGHERMDAILKEEMRHLSIFSRELARLET